MKPRAKPKRPAPPPPAPVELCQGGPPTLSDWDTSRSGMGGKGWHAGLTRFFPAPDGRKRVVEVTSICWAGFVGSKGHYQVEVKPKSNPVWDGECWRDFWDDPEQLHPPHPQHRAHLLRKDRACRWARQILAKHFPLAGGWVYRWRDGLDPSTLKDDPAEEEAISPCPFCQGPWCEHEGERKTECEGYIREFGLGKEAPAIARRPVTSKRTRVPRPSDGPAVEVLVDPFTGPITGTVGEEIAVLAAARPEFVYLLERGARALIVERGGGTVHLAQVAREMGVAMALVTDAVTRYPEGTLLTFTPAESRIEVH